MITPYRQDVRHASGHPRMPASVCTCMHSSFTPCARTHRHTYMHAILHAHTHHTHNTDQPYKCTYTNACGHTSWLTYMLQARRHTGRGTHGGRRAPTHKHARRHTHTCSFVHQLPLHTYTHDRRPHTLPHECACAHACTH